jgi:hypothetical protein
VAPQHGVALRRHRDDDKRAGAHNRRGYPGA